MGVQGVITTETVTGSVTDFGFVSPDQPLILSETKIRMIEKKRGMLIGEVPMPIGVTFTLEVLDDVTDDK
jgi:hypothetical protein